MKIQIGGYSFYAVIGLLVALIICMVQIREQRALLASMEATMEDQWRLYRRMQPARPIGSEQTSDKPAVAARTARTSAGTPRNATFVSAGGFVGSDLVFPGSN